MKSLFGGLLLAAGILIAGASGLCSLVFLGMGVSEPGGFLSLLPMVAMIGGVPFVLGLGLLFAGRALLRSAREPKPEALADVFEGGDQADS